MSNDRAASADSDSEQGYTKATSSTCTSSKKTLNFLGTFEAKILKIIRIPKLSPK